MHSQAAVVVSVLALSQAEGYCVFGRCMLMEAPARPWPARRSMEWFFAALRTWPGIPRSPARTLRRACPASLQPGGASPLRRLRGGPSRGAEPGAVAVAVAVALPGRRCLLRTQPRQAPCHLPMIPASLLVAFSVLALMLDMLTCGRLSCQLLSV
jgi:hypothetical protein